VSGRSGNVAAANLLGINSHLFFFGVKENLNRFTPILGSLLLLFLSIGRANTDESIKTKQKSGSFEI